MKKFLLVILFICFGLSNSFAGTKTLLIDGLTGEIDTDTVGNTSFEIEAAADYKCVRIEFDAESIEAGNALFLMGEKHTDDTWEYVYFDGVHVTLNAKHPSVCPAEIRTYILKGTVTGTVSAYTEEP